MYVIQFINFDKNYMKINGFVMSWNYAGSNFFDVTTKIRTGPNRYRYIDEIFELIALLIDKLY